MTYDKCYKWLILFDIFVTYTLFCITLVEWPMWPLAKNFDFSIFLYYTRGHRTFEEDQWPLIIQLQSQTLNLKSLLWTYCRSTGSEDLAPFNAQRTANNAQRPTKVLWNPPTAVQCAGERPVVRRVSTVFGRRTALVLRPTSLFKLSKTCLPR